VSACYVAGRRRGRPWRRREDPVQRVRQHRSVADGSGVMTTAGGTPRRSTTTGCLVLAVPRSVGFGLVASPSVWPAPGPSPGGSGACCCGRGGPVGCAGGSGAATIPFAVCQSRSCRQPALPLLHPSSAGRVSYGPPIRRTNRLPVSSARSETRGQGYPSGWPFRQQQRGQPVLSLIRQERRIYTLRSAPRTVFCKAL